MVPDRDFETAHLALPKGMVAILLALVVCSSLYVRVHGAAQYHYSPDDMMEIHIASQRTLPELLHTALHETLHPPLGYIVRHYWLKLSFEPWVVRSEALLWGLLLIPLYYAIGNKLSGNLAGIIAAILMGFSQGCIVQSFVVRNYTLFLFLVSCSFYYYTKWHTLRKQRFLIAYAAFGCLACFTHFSGMFTFFSIAACECLWLFKTKARWNNQAVWLLVNLAIGIAAAAAYVAWLPLLQGQSQSFAVDSKTLLAGIPIYPFSALGYILPGIKVTMGLILLSLLLLFLPARENDRTRQLRFYLCLGGCALLVGTALFGSGLYPFLGSRRSLWLAPCILPVTACVITELLERIRPRVALLKHPAALCAAAIILFVTTGLDYTSAQRFGDRTEYPLTEIQWQMFNTSLNSLTPFSIVIAEKDDSVLLEDPFPYIHTSSYPDKNEAKGAELAALVPYRSNHILINPLYHRIFSGDMLLAMLEYARAHGMLDHAMRFVFLHTPWSVYPIEKLARCEGIEKKILIFPPSAHTPPARKEMKNGLMLVVIPRTVLFEDILARNGKGRACLSGAGGGT